MPRFFRAVYAKLGAREPIVFMVASVLGCRRNVIARSDIVELVMRITSGKAPVKRSWLPPILMELLAVPPPYTHIEVPGSGRGVLYIMRSPQFEPELFKPLEFHAVGSGEGVIEEISTVHDMIVAGEIGNSFMEAMWFHQAINEFIETKGIKSVGGLIPMLKVTGDQIQALGMQAEIPLGGVTIQLEARDSGNVWVQRNLSTRKEIQLVPPWDIPRELSGELRFDDLVEAFREFNTHHPH
jgi:hypothetical protein